MGWSYEHRDKGTSNLDHFRQGWGNGYELLDGATVGGTFYGALRTPEGSVIGLVILTRWTRDWYNFGMKEMTEEMGPVESRCPERILDMLTDPAPNEYATEWREACREYHARLRQVKRGSIISLWGSGADTTYQVVDLRRNLFREHAGMGGLVRIPWWRSARFEVITAAV